MNIALSEVQAAMMDVLSGADVQDVDTVYEKIDDSDDLKLVVFINRLMHDSVSIMYTKLLFRCNAGKQRLVDNSFSYLHDINCQYIKKNFGSIDEFKDILSGIITGKKFGDDLLVLSKFVEQPASLVNEWLRKYKVTDKSVTSVTYDPMVAVMPCDSLSFPFNIKVNDSIGVDLVIRKESAGVYNYFFTVNGETTTVTKDNLSSLVETVASQIKNY